MICRQAFRLITHKMLQKKTTYLYKPSRFHETHMKMEKNFDNVRRAELKYNIGLYSMVFALAWAAVPFYKLFCEHFGLDGDLKQKDYSEVSKKKIDIHRKFTLTFKSEMDPKAQWDFEPVQTDVTVHAGETALVFYRAFNKETKPIVGFSTYQIFPEDASLYFAKIQCFCFNQQLLNPKEELMLPIYFYLEPEIADDPILDKCDQITIIYSFLKSRNQDLAKMAAEEIRRVKRNKMILMKMRKQREAGEVQGDDFSKIKNEDFSEEDIDNFNEYEYEQQLDSLVELK